MSSRPRLAAQAISLRSGSLRTPLPGAPAGRGRSAPRPRSGGRRRRQTMSNKPTHTAYVVTEPKEGSERKGQWPPVGAVGPHRNGIGFDLVIPAGISVAGRIVCVERKDEQQGD